MIQGSQTARLPWRILKEAEDWLWEYPDNLAAFRMLYADRAQCGGYQQDDEGFQRHLLAWSDPTANHAHVCEQDTAIRDLAHRLVPVATFRCALRDEAPVLARVLDAAFLNERTRTSGAYVIAQTVRCKHEHVRPAKEAILDRFARQVNLV